MTIIEAQRKVRRIFETGEGLHPDHVMYGVIWKDVVMIWRVPTHPSIICHRQKFDEELDLIVGPKENAVTLVTRKEP